MKYTECPDFPEDCTEQNENEDTYYTPETIAWKLYQDDDDKPLTAKLLGFGVDDGTCENEYTFELLLSVFLEMLIHMMKIDSLKNSNDLNDPNDKENTDEVSLEFDFEKFDMNLFFPIIRNKFKKIFYLCSVETYDRNDDKDYLLEIVKKRYSRIILRKNKEDSHYFESIGSLDEYDFIPCDGYKQQRQLKNIFSIMSIGPHMYKIRFDKISLPTK